jgi:hypothetical protein
MTRLSKRNKDLAQTDTSNADTDINKDIKKTSNLSIPKKSVTKPSVPIRFDNTEVNIIKDIIDEFGDSYTNLNRTDIVRAAVRMLKKANKKTIEKAIDSARLGKTS